MEYFSVAESVNMMSVNMMKKLICSTLAVGNVTAAIAGSTNITVDFSAQTGKDIKPLHGINNSPVSLYKPLPELQDAGIPYVRLHDTSGAYGGNCYVDVPNIFPDFDADENDPSSYRFEFTDAYLKQLNASGMKIFYRLGVTIENHYRIHAYRIAPPKDFAKWARICEHIIRHYNEGWANGFHYNIQYWEIWNEPENPPMWSGTREQFFELYRIASTHLKKCFPQLKIGGYASCGFLALTNPNTDNFHKSFLTWFEDFLKFAKKHDLPLDFFSWHKYFNNARQLIPDANYVRQTLDKYGFTKTESIFNEWNYYSGSKETVWDDVKNHKGASTAAEAFIRLQQLPVDKAMWEDFDLEWTNNATGIDEFPVPGRPDIHADFGKYCYVGLRHSLSHGWSCGPAPFLTERVLGVSFPEFGKVLVKPDLGDLEYVCGKVPVAGGVISVEADASGKINIDAPSGIEICRK